MSALNLCCDSQSIPIFLLLHSFIKIRNAVDKFVHIFGSQSAPEPSQTLIKIFCQQQTGSNSTMISFKWVCNKLTYKSWFDIWRKYLFLTENIPCFVLALAWASHRHGFWPFWLSYPLYSTKIQWFIIKYL